MITEDQLKEVSEIYMLALCIWREARNQTVSVMWGVANVVKNRVKHPGWWGNDITSVILCHYQFSSFNANDPNSNKYPRIEDHSWNDCLRAAHDTYYNLVGDNTCGATMYYDKSLDANPPKWSVGLTKIVIGDMRFFTQEKGEQKEVPS